jgi:hypothetical protein
MSWIQEEVGDAVLAFFPGKMPRAAAARKGATFESGDVLFSVRAPSGPGCVTLCY